MKKSLFYLFAATVAMTSCTTNEDVLEVSNQRDLTFGTFVDKATKGIGTVSTLETENATFGVWGYYVDAEDFTAPTHVFNAEGNVTKVTRGTEAWSYSEVAKWTPLKNYRFYAYAPHDIENGTIACDPTNNKMNFSAFKVVGTPAEGVMPYAPQQHVDLMVANRHDRDLRTAFDNSKIGLNFKHILTNVNIEFNTTSLYQISLHDVKLNGVQYTGDAVSTPATDGVATEWTPAGDAIAFAGAVSENFLVKDGDENGTNLIKTYTSMANQLMIPQEFNEGKKLELSIKYKVGGQGEDGNEYFERTVDLTSVTAAWLPGNKITYKITINTANGDPNTSYDIVFGQTTTTEWVESSQSGSTF